MTTSTPTTKKTNLSILNKIKLKHTGLSNKDKTLIRLQTEYKEWEQLQFSFHQASKYLSLKEEEEVIKDISGWRSYAQTIASALYPYYQKNKLSVYDSDLELGYHHSTKNETEKDMDNMYKMLHELHIDPETIHYSLELGEFY
ncbi:unnamed protein product [Cunninghamella blakesleeana]